MSRPASIHPLDTELLDYVEGTGDAETADSIAAHLGECLLCRIKRQRLAGAPPMEFTDVRSVVAPGFVVIDSAPGEGRPQPGDLWLTNSDDATMILVKSVRADGEGVVVLPVTLDIEAADQRVMMLDESASPLAVPLAIYEDLAVSLPNSALAERITPRADVDLLSLTDNDEGASRGAPIQSQADPRLEVRQYLVDRLTSLDPYGVIPDEEQDASESTSSRITLLRDELLLRRGPNCDVQELRTLPAGTTTPPGWSGIASVADFTVRVIVIETPQGLQEAPDFTAAQALVTWLAASAVAVCRPDMDTADVYDAPALFGAFQLPEGTRSSDPIIAELWLPDAVAKYLDQKRIVLSMVAPSTQHAPRVDASNVLAKEVLRAIDDTVKRAPKLGPEKKDGYRRLPTWRREVADVLKRALEPDFDPQWIADTITGSDQ